MTQQGDVHLFQENNHGNITVENGVIEMSGGLETAAYLSLFGGNEDCSGRDTCPFSWWGNFSEIDKAKRYISETQYLLKSLPAITANLRRIEDAAIRDLNWFLENKIASSVTVVVTIPVLNTIKINVTIEANGIESSFEFVENWKATTLTSIVDDSKDIGTIGLYLEATIIPLDFITLNTVNCDDSFEVDWGDGIYITYSAGDASAVATGNILIRSVSPVTRIRFITDTFENIDLTKVSALNSANGMCHNLSNLIAFDIGDTRRVVDFTNAWNGCTGLTSFPVSVDLTSGVDFTNTWQGCTGLTSFPVYNYANAKNFTSTWQGCTGLTSFGIAFTPNVENFTSTWQGCTLLPTLFLTDTSAGLLFNSTFKDCTSLASIFSLDTTIATDATDLFLNTTSLISPNAPTQVLLATVPPGYDFN